MNSNLENIDNYFKGQLTPEEIEEFDKRIVDDPTFAEDVAFYLATQQAAKELQEAEDLSGIKKIPLHKLPAKNNRGLRRLWPYMTAAAVISGLIVGWVLFSDPVTPQQLADTYIQSNFQNLEVSMGTEDSLQKGFRLYNEGKLTEATQQFKNIIKNDTSSFTAIKYAGIVSLRLNNFDQALSYFQQLETFTLHSNPAKFYKALTLLKRNQPGDKQEAKQLLQQVVENDLEGKQTAQQWLEKL